MKDATPISDLEHSIFKKLGGARFPPGTASKRFVRDYSNGYVKQLSPRGRKFLALIARRFRRQYVLTDPELAWVAEWIDYVSPVPNMPSQHLRFHLDSLPRAKPRSL